MLFSKYLEPFTIYIIILFLLFSLSVSAVDFYSIVNLISYVFLHFLIIYLCLYYYRISLYLVYFFCGLGMDLLIVKQIGPHLFVFMMLLILFNLFKKYFKRLNSTKIFLLILLVEFTIIFLEQIISYQFFNYQIDYYNFLKLIIISLIISYPIFLLFYKIDNYK